MSMEGHIDSVPVTGMSVSTPLDQLLSIGPLDRSISRTAKALWQR